MTRIATLTSYLIRTLSRSLAGIVPIALALAFGIIAFEYGMDQAQFMTVAGIGQTGPYRLRDIQVTPSVGSPSPLTEVVDSDLLKAGWNLLLVQRDGSAGVHNPVFVDSVLDSAISQLP